MSITLNCKKYEHLFAPTLDSAMESLFAQQKEMIITWYNKHVKPDNRLNLESLRKVIPQRTLTDHIDQLNYETLMMNTAPAHQHHMHKLATHPYTACWLRAKPTYAGGVVLNPTQYKIAMKMRFLAPITTCITKDAENARSLTQSPY